ncbi:MAG: GntR family transcriptional regulator [Paracoccus sp. (in: a-proteobacteria)]|uniref:GntR family transcriptional regulator n=1 Tax=Paracoccus sp. TaxID=267 RepID=UPI0026DF58DC|nr:GntR family transcriptional regulator [Paracoccus sp. (in: a-proteobacteria)]MDO5614094.1 GntR family transcriptional regulator [Paracoccus sp. (in: a-proteobacteria)]
MAEKDGPELTSLADTLASRIAAHIRAQNLRRGERLTERRLAEQFRVSRSPIRAAMKQLAAAGVLKATERSGYQILDADAAVALSDRQPATDPDEQLYLTIARDRVQGRLPDRISENEFLRRYDLTRGQLGRLLRRMSQEGWIERLPGHGWEFQPLLTSLESYRDSYRFRQLIEPAGLLEPGFALNRPALEQRLEQQEWLVAGGIWSVSDARLFDLNSGMHETLMECSGNLFLIDALRRVDRLRRLFDYGQTLDRDSARDRCVEHVHLLQLVLAGKNADAADYLRAHLTALVPLKAMRLRPAPTETTPAPED